MTKPSYTSHIETLLRDVDSRIRDAEARFQREEGAGRADALHELSRLRIRHDELAERIDRAKQEGADDWSTLHTSFREEIDGLSDALEKWLMNIR